MLRVLWSRLKRMEIVSGLSMLRRGDRRTVLSVPKDRHEALWARSDSGGWAERQWCYMRVPTWSIAETARPSFTPMQRKSCRCSQ